MVRFQAVRVAIDHVAVRLDVNIRVTPVPAIMAFMNYDRRMTRSSFNPNSVTMINSLDRDGIASTTYHEH